tara:strand:- start:3489 stop:3974 length:486 start_codon:yes stop_codon:yes gene_type:complete
MAWENIHRTVGANGQVTVETGYWSETINLLNWADAGNNGKSAYTSTIPISSDFVFTVLMKFSADLAGDTRISVEHSVDGTEWTTAAQSGTTIMATTDFTGGSNVSTLAFIDDSAQAEDTTGYYFVFDPEIHGSSKFMRFGIGDNGSANNSADTVTWKIVPN